MRPLNCLAVPASSDCRLTSQQGLRARRAATRKDFAARNRSRRVAQGLRATSCHDGSTRRTRRSAAVFVRLTQLLHARPTLGSVRCVFVKCTCRGPNRRRGTGQRSHSRASRDTNDRATNWTSGRRRSSAADRSAVSVMMMIMVCLEAISTDSSRRNRRSRKAGRCQRRWHNQGMLRRWCPGFLRCRDSVSNIQLNASPLVTTLRLQGRGATPCTCDWLGQWCSGTTRHGQRRKKWRPVDIHKLQGVMLSQRWHGSRTASAGRWWQQSWCQGGHAHTHVRRHTVRCDHRGRRRSAPSARAKAGNRRASSPSRDRPMFAFVACLVSIPINSTKSQGTDALK